MNHYLLQLTYTPEAWAALLRNPQDRSQAVAPVLATLGGKMMQAWFCFGEFDLVAVMELPDNVSAAAFSLAVSAGGTVKAIKTTPLMTVEQGLEAMKKGAACGYRPVTKAAGEA